MYNFWKAGPLKFGRAKKPSKVQHNFWQLSTLITNISGTTTDIQNLKEIQLRYSTMWYFVVTLIPPAFYERSPVNFGPQTKKFCWLTLSHPSGFYAGEYISALRGFCALKILRALEIDQVYLAHTPTGTGVPPQKNFNRQNLKFGLKFSVLATITSGQVGVSPQNIFHTTATGQGS